VDVIVPVGSTLFYTVTLPCTLWFFTKNKGATAKRGFRDRHKLTNARKAGIIATAEFTFRAPHRTITTVRKHENQ